VRSDLPTGTVTFLFTDVEGSTRLLDELGVAAYAGALAQHRRLVREACAAHGGIEVDTQGDAFFFAFPTAPGALAAAVEVTEALVSGVVRVRIGLHTGTPLVTEEGYVGGDVHRAARIAAAGHGGQVLVSSSTAQLIELELTDLGEHRLKDLSASERIYQLGPGAFPALKSLYRTNLPVPATPFLGREQELAEVLSLLSSKDTRLLTLTGPGGIGKTRLALQTVAESSDRYPDGVWWIPLGHLREAGFVLETAAQVVGSRDGLAEHISDKSMLCLFDNFEQVVEAGAELADVLASCPNVDFVVTSRERLRVRGEQTYPVPPLAEKDGAALFSARARATDPAFTTSEAVAELCLRLDELPLALELAAARTALFSPEQLLERLSQRLDLLKGERDADPRQQTLRATIEWSYDLLTQGEQALFARLAVFAGGCSYAAAEQVADADPDTLQSLLDKSLLRKRESEAGHRYWMLETIREYALERVGESVEGSELGRLHAQYFCRFSERAEPELEGPDQASWLDAVEREIDNVRAALEWCLSGGDPELGARLASSLSRFWFVRGYVMEERRWLERALATAAASPPWLEAKLVKAAAINASALSEMGRARELATRRLELARKRGDRGEVAGCLNSLGIFAAAEGDTGRAASLLRESVYLQRELGDWRAAIPLSNLARIALKEEDLERADALASESVALAHEGGDLGRIIGMTAMMALVRIQQNRVAEAVSIEREVLRLADQIQEKDAFRSACEDLALMLVRCGNLERAAQLLGKSQALRGELGREGIGDGEPSLQVPPLLAGVVEDVRTGLRDEIRLEAMRIGRDADLRQLIEVALLEVETAGGDAGTDGENATR
jgi:predicted ATPase/class 3 adenylate cyclase